MSVLCQYYVGFMSVYQIRLNKFLIDYEVFTL